MPFDDDDDGWNPFGGLLVPVTMTTWMGLSDRLPDDLGQEQYEVFQKDGDVFVLIPRSTWLLLTTFMH